MPKTPLLVVLTWLILAPLAAAALADNYAIELDGNTGYLGCDLPGSIRSSELTLSAWILRAGPAGDLISPEPRGQAQVGLGFHFGLSAGKVFCAKGTGSGTYVILTGQTAAPVSSWHHVAATLDGSRMRVYLDGLLDGELEDASLIDWSDLPEIFPPGQPNYPSPAQLYIGADKHNALGLGPTIPDFSFYFGRIDEAQVWNRALTQAEIAFYRRISLTGGELGLIHYWKFDEGTGTTTADDASQADLTLYPGASWVISTAPVNVTGVSPPAADARFTRVRAFPNPMRRRATILIEPALHEPARVSIYDLSGRRVAELGREGETEMSWDGRDESGRAVGNGVYLVRADFATVRLTTRLLVLR